MLARIILNSLVVVAVKTKLPESSKDANTPDKLLSEVVVKC